MNQVSLESIGTSASEMKSYMEALRSRIGNPDRFICICGHQMARHETSGKVTSCLVSRAWCACSEPLAVLDADMVNPFRFSTSGFGKKHALSKGIFALIQAGKRADWLIDLSCFKCNTSEKPVLPTPLNMNLKITYSSGSKNVLLCEDCIQEVDHVFVH